MGEMTRSLKHNVPPYEVMRRAGEARTTPAISVPDRTQDEASPAEGGGHSWLGQWSDPMVLRAPRGVVVLVMLVLVALIILAYAAGLARGTQATAHLSATPPPEQPIAPSPSSPIAPRQRVPGMNYLVLATYSNLPGVEDEAKRLLAFLSGRGVEATAEIVHNEGLKIIDLRPFRDEEILSRDYNQYVGRLQALGVEWHKQHNGWRDFQGMNCQRYAGPAKSNETQAR